MSRPEFPEVRERTHGPGFVACHLLVEGHEVTVTVGMIAPSLGAPRAEAFAARDRMDAVASRVVSQLGPVADS